MKALTLWPEWAYAILKLGKRVENRGWLPPRGLTDFAIHAGKQIGGNGRDPNGDIGVMLQVASDAGVRWDGKSLAEMGYQNYRELLRKTYIEIDEIRSSVVCVVRLASVLPKRPQNFDGWHAPDSFGWVLDDVRPVERLVCRGAQGLWPVPSPLVVR